jgi:hypothetical protein
MPLSDVTEIEGCRNVKEPIEIPCFFFPIVCTLLGFYLNVIL